MEVGLLVRFGKVVPGREEKALDLFTEATEYCGRLLSGGKITFFEPFFLQTSDLEEETGFILVKGPAPEIFKIIEEEEFQTLAGKAYYLVDHFRWDLITVGEGITYMLERAAKVRSELGIT